MQEYISGATIANEISLLRAAYRGTVVLVEGDDDGRLLDRYKVREDRCRVVVAFGKVNALEALRLLRQRGYGQQVCVVLDADFWHLTGERPDDPDVVLSEFHDLEMDMFMSSAFDTLVRELADSGRVQVTESEAGEDLRTVLVRTAATVGVVRYANYRRGLWLRFRNVDLAAHMDAESLEVAVDSFISAVLDDSDPGVDRGDVMDGVGSVVIQDHELAQVARGHDAASVLAVALSRRIGDCAAEVASRDHIEAMLRMAYGRESFELSSLHREILEWEERTGGSVLD